MRNDLILIGWKEIHEKLFCGDNGKKSMSIQTLQRKHGPGLKAAGVLFCYNRGHARTPAIAGWKSVIQNYFIKLGQKEDAERRKAKQVRKGLINKNIRRHDSPAQKIWQEATEHCKLSDKNSATKHKKGLG